jgi:hypothetical protein
MRLPAAGNERSYRLTVDLSGIIFAGLAVAWAVYLIPKALRHHDEMARSRSVDRFSHTMRVLGRKGTESAAESATESATAPAAEVSARPERQPAKVPTRHPVTRESARRAAARRRRVLGLLLLAAAVVAGLAWRAIVPWWSVAIPGGLVLVFLVIARITVRRERARVADRSEPAPEAETEDTVGLSRDELAAAVSAPVDPSVSPEVLADEGSLWDPLPMTLPTYVHKARARRTVRTIELTQTAGVTSSGHDDADSALVAAAESAPAEQPAEERKVAGA